MMAAFAVVALAALAAEDPVVVHGSADVELLQAVRTVAGRVADWRGVAFPAMPLAVRAGEAERRAAALEILRTWIDAERLAARGRAWSDLGLGSEGTAAEIYAALAEDLDGMAVAKDGRRLFVDPGRLSEADFAPAEGTDPAAAILLTTGVRPDEPAAAHLADHALDLQMGAPGAPATTDALLAARAWIEGRANLFACRLLFEGVGAVDILHAASFDPSSVLQGTLVPGTYFGGSPTARSLLYFVYGEGFAQAAAVAKSGGPRAIARAASARRTSRDVLHPDRPPAGEGDGLPPLRRVPPGYALADTDSLGEQGIVTLVSVATGKDNLGLMAGDGWRADALFRYERAPAGGDRGQGFTFWVSRWISPAEAEDFAYGVGRVLQARFPGRALEMAGEGRLLVRTADRLYRLDRAGETVTVRAAPPQIDDFLEGEGQKPGVVPAPIPKK
jgi:hypothetical protein